MSYVAGNANSLARKQTDGIYVLDTKVIPANVHGGQIDKGKNEGQN